MLHLYIRNEKEVTINNYEYINESVIIYMVLR